MLKGYVSVEEVGRMLREWVGLHGKPVCAELSIRFRIQSGERDLRTTYAGSLGGDPWPDTSASAYTLEAVDAAMRPAIIKERDYQAKRLEDLNRMAAQLGLRLVPAEPAGDSRILKLDITEPDDSVNYNSN